MKTLFKGPIHKLRIHTVNPELLTTAFESTVVVKDSLYYKSRTGKFINFEHDTVLPSIYEAEANLLEIARIHKMQAIDNHCIYAIDSEIEPYKQVSNQEFKVLKKTLKQK